MLTCLHVYLRPHVVRHWPTLTIIWHHVTPIWLPYQDAPLQQALGIHFDSWFLHFGFRFSHWFSIRSFSKYFRLFRRFPGAQGSPARLPNYRILIFSRTHANHPLLAKISWKWRHSRENPTSARCQRVRPKHIWNCIAVKAITYGQHCTSGVQKTKNINLGITTWASYVVNFKRILGPCDSD